MKRTINAPPTLIPMVRRKAKPSLEQAEDDVEKFIIPKLSEYGFGSRLINGVMYGERLKVKECEQYSRMNPRWLLSKTDMYLEIWHKQNPYEMVIVRPFVVNGVTARDVKDRPRFNLNRRCVEYLDTIPEAIRIKIIHNNFYTIDLRFLIMSKTNQFWFGTYASIKEQSYYLTWRKDPNRLDRIAVKPDEHVGQFHSCKSDLSNQLLNEMLHFNKNFTYGNQQNSLTERT